jgi:hypothetical protein
MTKPKSVCNQLARRFPTALLVLHPETTDCGLSREWEATLSIKASPPQQNDHDLCSWPFRDRPQELLDNRARCSGCAEGLTSVPRNRPTVPKLKRQNLRIHLPDPVLSVSHARLNTILLPRQLIQPGQTDSQLLPIYRARQDHSDLLRVFATSAVPRFEIDHSGDSLSE